MEIDILSCKMYSHRDRRAWDIKDLSNFIDFEYR